MDRIIGLAFAFCILRIYALLQELRCACKIINAETLHEVSSFFFFFNKSIKLIVLQLKMTTSIKISLQLSNYAKKFMI